MSVYTYIILFFIYSIIGWIVETLLKLISDKKLINRGFLLGPYCPIYGIGALLMSILWKNYLNDPFILFVLIIITASILEYMTSYLFEKIFKARWWDYSNNFFNINGRICLETMIPFGLSGVFVLYIIDPKLINIINNLSPTLIHTFSYFLLIIFILDNIITFKTMFGIKNMIINIKSDSTEKINKLIHKKIEKHGIILEKRLFNAFPKLEILKNRKYTNKIKKYKKR